jgi:hypothetical protein
VALDELEGRCASNFDILMRLGNRCGSARSSASAVLAVCMALAGTVSAAQPNTAHATRQGQVIQQLEESLLRAMRERNRGQLEHLLSDEFDMIVAQEPGNPVERDLWIASVTATPSSGWELEQVTVSDLGELAIASFLLRSTAGAAKLKPPVFVVDVWRREDARWRLLSRHAALATGSRSDIPGDAAVRSAPKKY